MPGIPTDSVLFASPLSSPPTSRRAAGTLEPLTLSKFEPLSFAKVPVSPPCRSASTSTDCESTLSDVGADLLSRSPSLLTSLIQTQTRRSARTTPATTPGVSPTMTPAQLPGTSRPILRRCSSGAVSDAHAEDAGLGLTRRRSCLKFAVAPRPLQLPNRSSVSAASSRRASGASSRLTSPRCATPALEEEDDEEDEYEPTTPAFPAFDSDDAGYQEDSEDGFTSDEDGPPLVPRAQWPSTWGKQGATPAPTLAPILWTAARRAADLAEPSTDDGDEPGPAVQRRPRVRIRDDDGADSRSRGRCSRHRSPPPDSRMAAVAELSAPPAARSPSAADLCRRRSGAAPAPTSARSPAPPAAGAAATRGWRSDDCSRRAPRGVTFMPQRKPVRTASQPPAPRAARVQFAVTERKCSMVVRGDEAPANAVDEVHVLAGPSEQPCPRAQLRALTS